MRVWHVDRRAWLSENTRDVQLRQVVARYGGRCHLELGLLLGQLAWYRDLVAVVQLYGDALLGTVDRDDTASTVGTVAGHDYAAALLGELSRGVSNLVGGVFRALFRRVDAVALAALGRCTDGLTGGDYHAVDHVPVLFRQC